MRFGWVTINVRDMQSSLSFYEGVVGLNVKRSLKPMPGTEIVFLGFGDRETEVELIQNENNSAPKYGKDISIGFGERNCNAGSLSTGPRGEISVCGRSGRRQGTVL